MKQIFLMALLLASVQISVAGHHEALPVEGNIRKSESAEATKAAPMQHLPAFNVGTAEASFEAPEIITEIPAGESKYYEKQSSGCYVSWSYVIEFQDDFGAKIIFTEDGEVYFQNFMSMYTYDHQGYVKGKMSDDGKNIQVTFPQTFCYAPDGSGIIGTLCVGKVHFGETCDYTTEETVVNFKIDDEGKIDMDDDVQIVLIWDNGETSSFSGFADYEQHYALTDSPLDIPQDVPTEEWAMSYGSPAIHGDFVEVGIAGDEVFIKGFSYLLPEAVMKGNLEGDIIRVKQMQLMGVYGSAFIYLMFGDEDVEYFDVSEDVFFKFDSSSKTITVENPTLIMLPSVSDEDGMFYLEAYWAPRFEYQGPITPAPPVEPILAWIDEYPEEYATSLCFYLPPFNVDGKLVKTDNYYYNVFVDGDIYIFDSSEYAGLEKYGVDEMYDIPYKYSFGGEVIDSFHKVYLFATDITEIGIQGFIIEDGVEYRSEMLTCPTSKVEELDSNKGEIISREYFDISGKKITGDYKGIVIERQTTSDGSIKVNKVIRR